MKEGLEGHMPDDYNVVCNGQDKHAVNTESVVESGTGVENIPLTVQATTTKDGNSKLMSP